MADKGKDLDSHKIDEETVIEGELIDKSTVEMIVEIRVDKISEGILVMTETDQEKEALCPEGMVIDAITVQNSGNRNRLKPKATTNRDRIGCFRCREYDHFANECPNNRVDDSDGYKSHHAALQLMTTELDTHENFDTIKSGRQRTGPFKLVKGKNASTPFLPKEKKGGQVRNKITYIPDREMFN